MSLLILGLNGCGKTTVGRMVAEKLGLLLMDAEDYYFPVSGDFSISRTQEEAHRLMELDAGKHGGFVLCCVRCNISETLLQKVRLAVVLRAPAEVRAQRIIQREEVRFDSRVLPGGDMYESQKRFHAFAAARTEETVDRSLSRLQCPVLEMDALLSPQMIAEKIIQTCQGALQTAQGTSFFTFSEDRSVSPFPN